MLLQGGTSAKQRTDNRKNKEMSARRCAELRDAFILKGRPRQIARECHDFKDQLDRIEMAHYSNKRRLRKATALEQVLCLRSCTGCLLENLNEFLRLATLSSKEVAKTIATMRWKSLLTDSVSVLGGASVSVPGRAPTPFQAASGSVLGRASQAPCSRQGLRLRVPSRASGSILGRASGSVPGRHPAPSAPFQAGPTAPF
nr:hypothetical protein Iba_chr12fCG12560 [Ipomoea batatas]